VDDDASVRNSLRRLLTMHESTVRTYASAESFLLDAGRVRNGCLLLDISMPGLTGIELLKRLRSENWHLPAVLMTSLRVDAPLREKAAQVGAFSVLEKPIDVDVLLTTISQAVFQQRSKRDTAAG